MPAESNPYDRALVDLANVDDAALVKVLRHINRSTRAGRERAARDPVTRMYLQSGLRLLAAEFQAGVRGEDEDPQPPPFFAWVSRARVAGETVNEPATSGLPRHGTSTGLRDRWDPHRDFIADLLLVALASDHWSSSVSNDSEALVALMSDDLVDAIHRVASLDIQALTNTVVAFQVQLIATSFAERDPLIRGALKELYRVVTDSWAGVYSAILEARGFTLRPGIDIDGLTSILTALAEGFALRLLADPAAPVQDRGAGTTLLGTAAVALLLSCVDFLGEGTSLEQALRATLLAHPS